jgi:hypothetical protein
MSALSMCPLWWLREMLRCRQHPALTGRGLSLVKVIKEEPMVRIDVEK